MKKMFYSNYEFIHSEEWLNLKDSELKFYLYYIDGKSLTIENVRDLNKFYSIAFENNAILIVFTNDKDEDSLEIMSNLSCIDYIIYSDESIYDILLKIRPHYIINSDVKCDETGTENITI